MITRLRKDQLMTRTVHAGGSCDSVGRGRVLTGNALMELFMKTPRAITFCAFTLALVGLTAAAARGPAPGTFEEQEDARIEAHLANVELELRARDVAALTVEQRQARARHIEVLREYREAGEFPRNTDIGDRRAPYFVDRAGTLCAMAYLIAKSGRASLVERVATTSNNAYIAELANDAQLLEWLRSAGLTIDEAARIQPKYQPLPPSSGDRDYVTTRYAVGSVLAAGVGGASIGLNLTGDIARPAAKLYALLGMTAGSIGLAMGASKLGDEGGRRDLAMMSTAIGAASTAIGARALILHSRRAPAATERATRAPQITVAPTLALTQGAAPGAVLTVRF
jgi:hypothetical protein